jgi:alkylation response protein AidB-like acyl-CoA dehydrogenase
MTTERHDEAVDAVGRHAESWYRAHWDPSLSLGTWWRLLADSGWGQPTWPADRFGRGLSGALAGAALAARRRVGAIGGPGGIATMLTGPTLLAHGTSEQLDRYLRGVVTGEDVWCQLFSEPSAGSDLASLSTRAERDGDRWVVNGQKVWTSGADIARYGLLVARTDPEAPKHRGLTYFLLDMRQPGVEVRPLRDLTGRAHFNEVFLTDAMVDASDVVGSVDDGWRVTLTTLASERASLGARTDGGGGKLEIRGHELDVPIREIVARSAAGVDDPVLKLRGFGLLSHLAAERDVRHDAVVRHALAATYVRQQVAGLTARRGRAAPSVQKLALSANLHHLGRSALDVEGPYGTLAGADALLDGRAFEVMATAFTISIGGGTDQIQRNIVGERVLGLPKESEGGS